MWPFSTKLSDRIGKPHEVKVCGVKFLIRKISTLDHISGAKVLQQVYELYQTKDEKARAQATQINTDKIKAHYVDVFCSAVISPRLSRKPDEKGTIFVENLLIDWELVLGLYEAIVEFTYGKKNSKRIEFRASI